MFTLRFKLLYPVLLLFVFALSVHGGGNRPSGVHPSSTYSPQPSQTPSICRNNHVQCCWKNAESNSEKGQAWLKQLGIKSLPKKPEEVGYNCTVRSDAWIREGKWYAEYRSTPLTNTVKLTLCAL